VAGLSEGAKIDPSVLIDASNALLELARTTGVIRRKIEEADQAAFEKWLEWRRGLRHALQYAAIINISVLQTFDQDVTALSGRLFSVSNIRTTSALIKLAVEARYVTTTPFQRLKPWRCPGRFATLAADRRCGELFGSQPRRGGTARVASRPLRARIVASLLGQRLLAVRDALAHFGQQV
jgi:hypothetical protein